MKKGLYRKLALSGIRKNSRLYLPYILTCAGTVMMCYIISFLSQSSEFGKIPGGNTVQGFLSVGIGVMAVFSLIFLFYTNSFLIRRRKKELGLYNILGLGKRNLAAVLAAETFIVALVSIAGGLLSGILFSKAGGAVPCKDTRRVGKIHLYCQLYIGCDDGNTVRRNFSGYLSLYSFADKAY